MTMKGGTSQACAACKYQRRRCKKDCALAPYFPADQSMVFRNAHRLFGVRNILNIFKQVHPENREDAMKSIIFEANMRAQFPVYGCYGLACRLHFQLEQMMQELRRVETQLAICKNQLPNTNGNVISMHPNNQSQPNFGIEFPIDYHRSGRINGVLSEADDARVDQSYYGNHNAVDSMFIQSDLVATAHGFQMQEIEVSHLDGIPFDTMADDRQSYVDSREACDSSAESSFKGGVTFESAIMENNPAKKEMRSRVLF